MYCIIITRYFTQLSSSVVLASLPGSWLGTVRQQGVFDQYENQEVKRKPWWFNSNKIILDILYTTDVLEIAFVIMCSAASGYTFVFCNLLSLIVLWDLHKVLIFSPLWLAWIFSCLVVYLAGRDGILWNVYCFVLWSCHAPVTCKQGRTISQENDYKILGSWSRSMRYMIAHQQICKLCLTVFRIKSIIVLGEGAS